MSIPSSWVGPFGNAIWPSSNSYIAYNLSILGSITLQFPQVATTEFVTAGTISVTLSSTATTMTMPDVTIVSIGTTFWIVNKGSVSLTVNKNDGSTLLIVPAGTVWAIQIIDNSTAPGIWDAWQLGAGSSSVTAAQLAGAGLIVDPLALTRLATNITSRTFSSNYTLAPSDRAVLLVWTGGSGTLHLPDIATLATGFLCYVRNLGTGVLTIQTDVGGQTINGLPAINPKPGESFTLVAGSGVGYYTVGDSALSTGPGYVFPDGAIATPSIAFISDPTSGFSHTWTSDATQKIDVSLHGALQLSVSTSGSVPKSIFTNIVEAQTYISDNGLYTLSSDITKSRMQFSASSGLNNSLTTSLYFTTLAPAVTSTFDTSGYFNISPADYQRDSISYAALMRVML